MQESVSMHKSPTPVRHSRMNQARSEEEEKERKTGKTEARRLMERKAAQQNKNTSEELKQRLLKLDLCCKFCTAEDAVASQGRPATEKSLKRHTDGLSTSRDGHRANAKDTPQTARHATHAKETTIWHKT